MPCKLWYQVDTVYKICSIRHSKLCIKRKCHIYALANSGSGQEGLQTKWTNPFVQFARQMAEMDKVDKICPICLGKIWITWTKWTNWTKPYANLQVLRQDLPRQILVSLDQNVDKWYKICPICPICKWIGQIDLSNMQGQIL